MNTISEETIEETKSEKKSKNIFRYLRKPSKQMFWAWIAYQTIKGSLTLSFIWIPLLWAWLH